MNETSDTGMQGWLTVRARRDCVVLTGALLALALPAWAQDEKKDDAKPAETEAAGPAADGEEAAADADPLADMFTAGVELHSKYIQRGMSADPDSKYPAIQPSVEIVFPMGFQFNYWGSTVTYTGNDPDNDPNHGVENDLGLSWGTEFGAFSARLGAYYYYFNRSTASNAAEAFLNLGWAGKLMGREHSIDIAPYVVVMESDWGKPGETYINAVAEMELPWKFNGYLDFGWQIAMWDETLETRQSSSHFRNLNLILGREVAPGVELKLDFLFAGNDRDGNKQPNTLMWAIAFGG